MGSDKFGPEDRTTLVSGEVSVDAAIVDGTKSPDDQSLSIPDKVDSVSGVQDGLRGTRQRVAGYLGFGRR